MTLSAYLPQDRRRALARGESLPDRAHGALLFADISGFTPFAKALRLSYGARRGAEALSRALDAVYAALIGEVERYGGSVVNFAGDAIFCWFEDERPTTNAERPTVVGGQRALACAAALQAAMARLRATPQSDGAALALSLKAAVVVGDCRRFVVGDHDHYRLDVLAGQITARAAAAEQLARPGEIVVDEAAVRAFADGLTAAKWRVDEATGERFAIVQPAAEAILPPPESLPDLPDLPAADLRRWLHPGVWERTQSAHASLLTEFRPCAALFFRFGGIDYDSLAAARQLDAVVRLLQQVAARYDGLLVDLIIGEKGGYSYLNFGALTVHEDDARRALAAALTLAAAADKLDFLEPPQIGLAQAVMRVGSYGGPTRRHYDALGDGPVLAARLMQAAAPGQILADELVWRAAIEQFQAIPQPPLTLKGIAQPVRAYAVTGERPTRRAQLLQPDYPLPLVGRQAELMVISAKLALTLAGRSQIVAVIGEAGIGKSRLLAEAIRLAQRQGFTGYGGACQSAGRDIAYHPWRTVWRALFGLEEGWPPAKQVARLTAVLQERLPHRLNGLPLLGRLLDLPIRENEFTSQLTPQYRQSVLRALLEEFLQQAAQQTPLLIVLEDLHWLDPLSHDLLEALAQATAAYPVCFLLAYRPSEQPRLQAPRLEKRENFTPLLLTELSWAEAAQLARAKLAQLYPDGGGALYIALIDDLLARAQGNPFFLEELLNYLRDQDIKPGDMTDGRCLELPNSLHTLILSRIDQLPARQKMTMRAASVIGRRFPVKWLNGYYPELGDLAQLQADLVQLDALDLTLLETAEPEAAYLFKHIITQEVAYESLSFAARAELHERLAVFLEKTDIHTSLDLLAYHYAQSENQAKQREYFQHAAQAAREAFANETALAYYAQLAPLLREPTLEVALHLQWGAVLDLMGRYDEAEAHYRQALIVDGAAAYAAQIQLALGKLYEQRGDYLAALASLEQARQGWEALDSAVGLAQAHTLIGRVLWRQGIYVDAQRQVETGLTLAQNAGDQETVAMALHMLGIVVVTQGDYDGGQTLFEQSLAIRRRINDQLGSIQSLANLGMIALNRNDIVAAREIHEQSLVLRRRMGDKFGESMSLLNLGVLAMTEEDYGTAQALWEECLTLFHDAGVKWGIAETLYYLAFVADLQGSSAVAQHYFIESADLFHTIGDKSGLFKNLTGLAGVAIQKGEVAGAVRLLAAAETLRTAISYGPKQFERQSYEKILAAAQAALDESAFRRAWSEGEGLTVDEAVALALIP